MSKKLVLPTIAKRQLSGVRNVHVPLANHPFSSRAVAPLLRKVLDTENRVNGEHIERYQFIKHDGSKHYVEMRPSEARDVKNFKSKLYNLGAVLPEPNAVIAFLKDATSKPPGKRAVYEKRVGWLSDRSGFVLPNGFVGKPTIPIHGIDRSRIADNQGAIEKAGTAESWNSTVGAICAESSSAIAAVCASFAAPLLTITNRGPFALCFCGPSRSGKTSLISAAASAIGIGGHQNLVSWNLTDAQLEERLPLFNDMLFPIDDLQAMSGTDGRRYQRIHELSYRFAQGRTKSRHSSFIVKKVSDGHWNSIMITSNEKLISELAARNGRGRNLGEMVRLIEIPVLHGTSKHIFDLSKRGTTEDRYRQKFKALAEAVASHHGAAFSKYMNSLIRFGAKRTRFVEAQVKYFRDKVLKVDDSLLVSDVADKFGLLYAAGSLAIKFGIVPWSKARLFKAIKRSYRSACRSFPDEAAILKAGKAKLKALLDSFPSKEAWLAETSKVDGFREGKMSRRIWIVQCDRFNAIFASKQQRQLVLDWLIRTKRIEVSVARSARQRSPKNQTVWPDAMRRRSYTIYLNPQA